jgi:Arc/MetJ family transcription regulator
MMRTNIVIDDRLIRQAMRASRHKTKRAVVEAGLKLLVQVHGQSRVRRLRGKVAWEGDLKAMRSGRAQAVS